MSKLGSLMIAMIVAFTAKVDARMLVTTCGDSVPAAVTAVLANDLACTGPGAAVTVGDGGRLMLRRHVIAGGAYGVECLGACSVRGPGEITGGGQGIYVYDNGGLISVRSVHIHDNTLNGIYRYNAVGTLKLLHVELDHNLNGVDSSAAGDEISGSRVSVHHNVGGGVYGMDFVFHHLMLTENAPGPSGDSPGLLSERGGATLVSSILTGNASAIGGMDIATNLAPVLVRTTCGKSFQVPFDGPVPFPGDPSWGVCANDSPSAAFLDPEPFRAE
jgi:hypothetical protein